MWQVYEKKVIVLTWGGLMDLPAAGRRVETEYETRSKTCHEESADAIVPGYDGTGEGLNFKE